MCIFLFCFVLFNVSNVQASEITADISAENMLPVLIQRRDQVKTWASVCKPGQLVKFPSPYTSEVLPGYEGMFTATLGKCDQGDLMIFGGLSGFGAWFAGDMDWALARHSDQSLSQEETGRWVRGPSWVGKPLAYNAFSRDQATGLRLYFIVALDRIQKTVNPELKIQLQNHYKKQLYDWLHWIEFEGKGKMCVGDQRCDISANVGSVFYRVAERLGVLNSETLKWKIVKRLKMMKQSTGGFAWAVETSFTPIDYQMILKTSDILIESYLGDMDPFWIRAAAKSIEQKDPGHTFYSFLYQGVKTRHFNEILDRCPAQAPNPNGIIFQWMHKTINKTWSGDNGHSCMLALNLMIADLEGKIPWLHNDAKDGIVEIAKPCPLGFQKKGFQELNTHAMPLCESPLALPISEVDCVRKKAKWAGKATTIYPAGQYSNERQCSIPQNGFYSLRPISRICPLGNTFKGYQWGDWAVCKFPAALPTVRSKCVSVTGKWRETFKSPIDTEEYCITQSNYFFTANRISD